MPSAWASAIASHRLEDVRHGLRSGERPVAPEDALEVLAIEVFHHDVRRAVRERADVRDARHVLAVDLRGRARLAREARGEVGLGGAGGEEELESDALLELEVRRGDDDPHASHPEQALDAVLPRDDVALPDGADGSVAHRA